MRGRAEAARRAHNPEVGGSNPPPATKQDISSEVSIFLVGMTERYYLDTDSLPTIPVPHDCVIKTIYVENHCIVFDFEDDVSCYDSIAYLRPQAKSLTVRYHFPEHSQDYSVYRWVKPTRLFRNGCYECLTDVTDENHTTLLNLAKPKLEYIGHYVGYNSIIIDLYSASQGRVVLECEADIVEYEWKY